MSDTLPPLTLRQLQGINAWLDHIGETVADDRQVVIDACTRSQSHRAGYFRQIKDWLNHTNNNHHQ